MNVSIRTLTCAAAIAAFVPAFAQDEEESAEPSAEEVVGEVADDELVPEEKHIAELDQRIFTVLPYCKVAHGRVEVRQPGKDEWTQVEEGRFFPLGSSFRTLTAESRLDLAFGREVMVSALGKSSFGTRAQTLDIKSRSISLESGVVELKLPLGFPENMFTVTAPGFSVENPAGQSRYAYAKTGDGDTATVRCVSGVLTVKGRHFTIPAMHAANELEIRTSQDVLFTGLFGKSGDYNCHLDTGLMQEMDWEAQQNVIVQKSLDWKLSPQTAVRIFRKVPEIGKNLAVSVLTFDSNGELKNHWTFTEGRHEINTGDQGPASKAERARAAKALEEAAAAVDTTTTEASEEGAAEEE